MACGHCIHTYSAVPLVHDEFKWPCGEVIGLRAISYIDSDKEIIFTPTSECLTIITDKNDDEVPERFRQIWSSLSSLNRLSLKLCDEWMKCEVDHGVSKFGDYIRALPNPTDFDTPCHWSKSRLDDLPYPPLRDEVLKQRARWDDLYSKITETSSAASRSNKPCVSSQDLSKERFYWAMECVRSRAFQGAGIAKPIVSSTSLLLIAVALLGGATFMWQ